MQKHNRTRKHESKELLEKNEQISKIGTLSEESMNDSNSKHLANEESFEQITAGHTVKTSVSVRANNFRNKKNRRKTASEPIKV